METDGDRELAGGVAARYDNIPCANSHETRPSLFALVRCQTRKQCGPRTEAEESNGAGILNTPEYLPLRPRALGRHEGVASRPLSCTYGHVTDFSSAIVRGTWWNKRGEENALIL